MTGNSATSSLTALVVKARRPFYRSRPGRLLLGSTVVSMGVTLVIPYVPFIGVFGFVSLPGALVLTVVAITLLYVAATEVTKKWFYQGVA